MNEYNVKRLALVFSIQAEIEGMKFENMIRESLGQTHSYTNYDFCYKANELRDIANKHNEQL